ncbi:hypothetical protein LSCM4_06748 [Leishmania orientalis]|uniref:Uncharacterized protein n=1 Tax=Leishmania orientalis TaxID=2249476 RepID=A0A836GQ05_9TRYP|nr:hypothetical protein LSCM4_06748 [Leishmania orientalis]
MTSPTHSHASNTGSRRHHTPLLQERSSSLARRQEMLKRQNSQSFTVPPAPQQQGGADTDAAMPGTVVVCGVRSAFPLIPLTTTEQTTDFDESCVISVADSAGLPHALRSHSRKPCNALGRPPRVRSYEGQREQPADFDAEGDSWNCDAEEDEGNAAEGARLASSDAASPHKSDEGSSEEEAKRFVIVAEVIQPRAAPRKGASSQPRTKGAPSHLEQAPVRASIHAIMETTAVNTQQGRCSMHACGSSPGMLNEDQPESVGVRQRDGRYLAHESFESHTDDREGCYVLQSAKLPRLHTRHPRHKQAAISPYAQTTATMCRRSVRAADGEASAVKTNATSATSASQLLAMTERRHRSPGAGQGTPVALSGAMPSVLQAVGPRVMSAYLAAHARQQRAGMGSIQAGAAEVEKAHSPSLQAQEPQVMSVSQARRGVGQHAVESEGPWYTDADQQPSVLKTIGSRNLSRSFADPSRTNSRRSIYNSLLEHPSDRPVPAEDSAAQQQPQHASDCSSDKVSPSSPVAPLKNSTPETAVPPRAPVSQSVAKGHYSQASRYTSSAGTSGSEEGQDGHLLQAERATPKVVTRGTAAGAGDRRLSEVDEVHPVSQLQTRRVRLEVGGDIDEIKLMSANEHTSDEGHQQQSQVEEKHPVAFAAAQGSDAGESSMPLHHLRVRASIGELNYIGPLCAIMHENSTEGDEDEYIDACKESDDSTEYVSCYDVACQTSQHLLKSSREDGRGRLQSQEGEVGEVDVGKTSPRVPHYVGVNRWMCATGVCPDCHPNRQARGGSSDGTEGRIKSVWPLAPRGSLGYSAPPGLIPSQTHQGPAGTATAGFDARLPQLPSSSSSSVRAHPQRPPAWPLQQHVRMAPSARQRNTHASSCSSSGRHYRRDHYSPTVTSYHGGYCFTREWEVQQQQRRLWLRELQMEQRARRGATGAAYTSMLPLTCHIMQSRARAAGKEPRSYRYCNLQSQQMMIHTGFGRADLELDSYNDTLHGAPLIEPWQEDNDGAVRAIVGREANGQMKPPRLGIPTAAAVIGTADKSSTTDHSGHARPAADGAAKAGRVSVL